MSRLVGFIGIGNMGAPMAANLIRHGYSLVVDDLDGARRADFAAAHCAIEARTRHDFSAVTALVTMLPDGVAVRSALLERGVGAALSPGAVVVDTSSSAPADTRSLAGELARHGVGLVDAPVSGGVPKPWTGPSRSCWGRTTNKPPRSRWTSPRLSASGSCGRVASGPGMR